MLNLNKQIEELQVDEREKFLLRQIVDYINSMEREKNNFHGDIFCTDPGRGFVVNASGIGLSTPGDGHNVRMVVTGTTAKELVLVDLGTTKARGG